LHFGRVKYSIVLCSVPFSLHGLLLFCLHPSTILPILFPVLLHLPLLHGQTSLFLINRRSVPVAATITPCWFSNHGLVRGGMDNNNRTADAARVTWRGFAWQHWRHDQQNLQWAQTEKRSQQQAWQKPNKAGIVYRRDSFFIISLLRLGSLTREYFRCSCAFTNNALSFHLSGCAHV